MPVGHTKVSKPASPVRFIKKNLSTEIEKGSFLKNLSEGLNRIDEMMTARQEKLFGTICSYSLYYNSFFYNKMLIMPMLSMPKKCPILPSLPFFRNQSRKRLHAFLTSNPCTVIAKGGMTSINICCFKYIFIFFYNIKVWIHNINF